MVSYLKGIYTGPLKFLAGKSCLVRRTKNDAIVLTQFDDLSLPIDYTHGWREFFASYIFIYEPGKIEELQAENAALHARIRAYEEACDCHDDHSPFKPSVNWRSAP